jgi:hypothetical protein
MCICIHIIYIYNVYLLVLWNFILFLNVFDFIWWNLYIHIYIYIHTHTHTSTVLRHSYMFWRHLTPSTGEIKKLFVYIEVYSLMLWMNFQSNQNARNKHCQRHNCHYSTLCENIKRSGKDCTELLFRNLSSSQLYKTPSSGNWHYLNR